MSLGAPSSQALSESSSPTAYMRIFSSCMPKRRRKVQVAVYHRLYYKDVYGIGTHDPRTLNDFRGANNFQINRIKDDAATWDDIVETVKAEDSNDGKHSVTIQGLKASIGKATVELTTQSSEQRDIWVDQIRARFAPWKLIRQKLKELAAHAQQTSSTGNLNGAMEGIVFGAAPAYDMQKPAVPEASSDQAHNGIADKTWPEKLRDYSEQIPLLDLVDKSIVHGTGAVGTATTVTKLIDKAGKAAAKGGIAEKAGHVAETAQSIADISRCIAGASSVFQLVVLSARIVSMFAEANRGVKALPKALDRAVFLLSYTLRSLAHILDPSSNVEELYENFAFTVLEEIIDTMDIIEDQLWRRRLSRFFHSKVVKEVETAMKDLEHRVVSLDHTFNMSSLLKALRTDCGNPMKEPHHVPPEPSPYFIGRTREINDLKGILTKYGSAVISQFGGMGKTELMSALAQDAKQKNEVPGGLFWLAVDGESDSVVESIARFVDIIREKKMPIEMRKDSAAVVAQLEHCLSERQGRWMLCLDNADNPKLAPILDAVCALAKPSNDNGWVVVTSRRGPPKLWRRMKKEQKIILQPLTEVDSMVLLWREKNVLDTEDMDDDSVRSEIGEMEKSNFKEFDALKDLCACEGAYGLGGLPLALVQAGTYIGQWGCTFSKYLEELKKTSDKVELSRLLRETEQLSTVRDEQRSVLTTWKVSVDCLSETAYEVLRSIAMLGSGFVPEGVIRRIVERAADNKEYMNPMRDVLMEELVHGSSLVHRERSMEGDKFGMHRLVRRFVIADMERGSDLWKKSSGNALLSMHERIQKVITDDGYSMKGLPDLYSERYRQYIPHSLAIIENFDVPNSPNGKIDYPYVLCDIAEFADLSMEFFGRSNESESLWRSVLAAFEYSHEANRNTKNICNVARGRLKHIAFAMERLGFGLSAKGKLVEAESVLNKCLDMYRNIYGHDTNHSSIATTLYYLGILWIRRGKFDMAQSMYDECLEMERNIYGRDTNHPSIAVTLCYLGDLWMRRGKLDMAQSMFDKCLEMYRNIYGRDANHPEIATTLYNLGDLWMKRGKLDMAQSMYDECLEMYRNIYGRDTNHPSIAVMLCNLGHLWMKRGKLDMAQSMFDECLEMRRVFYGRTTNHPPIADTLCYLGDLWMRRGKLDMAQSMYDECLEMYRNVYGRDTNHPEIATTLCNLGILWMRRGKLDMAQSMFDECLEMRRVFYGRNTNHPSIADTLCNLGCLWMKRGKLGMAQSRFDECLEMYRNVYGRDANHPEIATTLYNLGDLWMRRSKLDMAQLMYDECLEMYRNIYGRDTNHPEIAGTLCSLGDLWMRRGNLDIAQSIYEKCLKMQRVVYVDDDYHPEIRYALCRLCEVCAMRDEK